MRALITGLNGTVAPALADALRASGAEIIRWDRSVDPPDSPEAVAATVQRVAPDWVCHLATGPEAWAGWIADACQASGARVLLTSSVSVFAVRCLVHANDEVVL
ncbi:MAG: NAD-dependent epimerase/dehydratase family protein, partial [Bacteroidota bacterium]